MSTKRTSFIYIIVSTLSILGLLSIFACIPSKVSPEDKAVAYRTISMEDYKDKVAGGWLGQATGVLWAQYTEGKWQGEMIPFDFDDWSTFDN